MAISFSEHYHIPSETIDKLGVFDVIMDVDARVFIDPALLPLCQEPEFTDARGKIEKYFANIIALMRHAKSPSDMFWKKADHLLTFREISGTCFGYSEQGTSGNAIGPVLREKILTTIKELLEAGESDPVIFELLGVFQEKMGCDRISDLITFILFKEILQYTQRIIVECKLPHTRIRMNYESYAVCRNPYNKKILLLLPQIILSPLPVSMLISGIGFVCHENQRVRDVINDYVDLGNRQTFTKEEIYKLMKNSASFRETLIDAYKSYPVVPYDFSIDKSGEYIWYPIAKEYTKKYPLDLSELPLETSNDALTVIKRICHQFADLIEDNGLYALLYDTNGKPKRESAAQLLFFGIATSYCNANNLDLIREGNNGRGPVDFKVSRGAKDKALVEVKLTSNSQLIHGIQTQLPIYMKQEHTKKAIYLIIDNGHKTALDHFVAFYNDLSIPEKEKIEYIVVDGTPKQSASKA